MAARQSPKKQSKRPLTIGQHNAALQRVDEVARRLRGDRPMMPNDNDDPISKDNLSLLIQRAIVKRDQLAKRRLALREEVRAIDQRLVKLAALIALGEDDEDGEDDDDDET